MIFKWRINEDKKEYEQFLKPVVMFDPDPFDDLTQADVPQLLNSAVWALLMSEDGAGKYPYSESEPFGFVVPQADIEKYFVDIISCVDVGKGKEEPDIYLKAMEILGTTADETCIFEDSHVNIVEVDKLHLDWKDAFERIRIYKHNAITEIEQSHGFEGVCQFAKMVKCPNEVGESYAYSANDDTYRRVLNILLHDKHEAIINFTKGFFSHYTFRNGINSIIPILGSLDFDKYKEINLEIASSSSIM